MRKEHLPGNTKCIAVLISSGCKKEQNSGDREAQHLICTLGTLRKKALASAVLKQEPALCLCHFPRLLSFSHTLEFKAPLLLALVPFFTIFYQ